MKQVTAEYIAGIEEGSAFQKANPDFSRQDIAAHIDILKRCLARGFAKPMADMFRGERDFWINQLKIRKERIK